MRKKILCLSNIFVLVAAVFFAPFVLAHSPHDVIFDVAVSPDYSNDKTAFIIVSNTLMLSTNGGYRWKKLANGLDHSSQLTSISISPAFREDGIAVVTSEHDGVYRSEDRGRSWKKANTGLATLKVQSVCFSPGFIEDHALVLLDGDGRLFISRDSARTWKPFFHDISEKITRVVWLDDGLENRLSFGTDDGSVMVVNDSGTVWGKIDGSDKCGPITAMAASPRFKKDGKIWIGSESCGVSEVDINSRTIKSLENPLENEHVTSLLAAKGPSGESVLYVTTWHQALFVLSVSDGSFFQKETGLSTDPQADDPHYRLPHFKGIADADGLLFLGGFDGLFVSANDADTWEQIDTIMLNGITGMDLYSDADGQNHQVALATYGAGAYLYDNLDNRWAVLNRGLAWTRLNDIVFSDNYGGDGILFSGSENDFLWFDADGEAWRRVRILPRIQQRVTSRIDRYLRKLGFSAGWWNRLFPPLPSDARFPTSIAPSSNIAGDGTIYFGTRSSGIYCSEDMGRSNAILWDSEGKMVTSLIISPNYEEDGAIFAGTYSESVLRSSDKGKSWRKSALAVSEAGKIVIDISPNFMEDRTLFAGHPAGLFRSRDGAQSWHAIGTKAFGSAPNVVCLAISPDFESDKTVLIGVKGHGLWVTKDGGEDFMPFGEELIRNNHQAKFIKFSDEYRYDNTIYVAASYGLFQSLDKGKSWKKILHPIRYENFREEIKYEGKWRTVNSDGYSALSATFSESPGSCLNLRFDGAGFSWIGDRSPDHGQATLTLDDLPVKVISLKSEEAMKSVEVFSMSGLDDRCHTLRIETHCVQKDGNCGSLSIDAIDIIPHENND